MPAAQAAPVPLSESARAAAVAARLGDDRTAGVYYEDGRLTTAVTDQAAARSVREAGGTAKVVTRSAARLNSVNSDMDRLAGIPNTAWGVDPSSNKVSVEIYDGVSAADRNRIEAAAATHGDAVRIERHSGKLQRSAYDMRGGLGIHSGNTGCSSAFNVADDSGKKFMLTAGHCILGGNYEWYRDSGNIYLGRQTDWEFEPGDWAVIEYRNSNVSPYGTVQYKDGSASQIASSRWVVDGEKVKRVGTTSQDLDGMILRPSITVNYDDGSTLYNQVESSLCNKLGDSGGAMFTGTTALGITSGGNYVTEPCGNTDAQPDRVSFYHPVQDVIIKNNVSVF
ncbi:S1 family peptidase [Streptomyces sp. NPDC055099]